MVDGNADERGAAEEPEAGGAEVLMLVAGDADASVEAGSEPAPKTSELIL